MVDYYTVCITRKEKKNSTTKRQDYVKKKKNEKRALHFFYVTYMDSELQSSGNPIITAATLFKSLKQWQINSISLCTFSQRSDYYTSG